MWPYLYHIFRHSFCLFFFFPFPRLHQTQNLLYDSTRDYLQLKYENRAHEKGWMAEKDRLLQELDRCKEQLNVSKEDVLHVSDHVLEQRQAQNMEIEVRLQKWCHLLLKVSRTHLQACHISLKFLLQMASYIKRIRVLHKFSSPLAHLQECRTTGHLEKRLPLVTFSQFCISRFWVISLFSNFIKLKKYWPW